MVSVSSDGFKDIRDHKNAEEEAKRQAQAASDQRFVTESLQQQLKDTKTLNGQLTEARTKLNQTATTAASTLNAALRSVDPFVSQDVVEFNAWFEIPIDQDSVRAYLGRLKNDELGNFAETEPAGNDREFRLGTFGYPDDKIIVERPLVDLAQTKLIRITIRRRGQRGNSLTADLRCDPSTTFIYFNRADMEKGKDSVNWYCLGSDIDWEDSTGAIKSYLDLVGATATVKASHPMIPSRWIEYSLHGVKFTTKNGREFTITRSGDCKVVEDLPPFYSRVCPGVFALHSASSARK